MIRGLAEAAVTLLNQLPALNGVYTLISPRSSMTGCSNIDYNDLKLEFGEYAQVFKVHEPTNTTEARTTGAIAMNLFGSAAGGYNLMSLNKGIKLQWKQWKSLPMPEWVVDYVEHMAEVEQQQELINNESLWESRLGINWTLEYVDGLELFHDPYDADFFLVHLP